MMLCKLLGHKFIKNKGGHVWTSEHCFRCGFSIDSTPTTKEKT